MSNLRFVLAAVALFAGTLVGVAYAFFLNYLKQTRSIRRASHCLRLLRSLG